MRRPSKCVIAREEDVAGEWSQLESQVTLESKSAVGNRDRSVEGHVMA